MSGTAAKAERLGIEEIWSDDKFTYVQGGKVLALYEINEDGKPSLIQYKYADGVYTVPKLLYDGYLADRDQEREQADLSSRTEQGMTGDPYEEADQQSAESEAKLVTPRPPQRSRKIVMISLLLVTMVLLAVICYHLVATLMPRPAGRTAASRPTTMTPGDSDNFARQQSGEADYLKGSDQAAAQARAEDTVLGQGSATAEDPYAEQDGVPKKTKAQEDAEHGRRRQSTAKSEAQLRRERAALEQQHRRQNDLDSSPVAVDFSDYFDKEATPAVVSSAKLPRPKEEAEEAAGDEKPRPSRLADVLREEGGADAVAQKVSRQQPHDPKDDYTFDSSFGKLYRLMEDTVIETVLVNRLDGRGGRSGHHDGHDGCVFGSGVHLLIPKGTRLLGTVSAVGSVNQERLFVAFHRMIMPDGYSVSLDKFQGLDVVGQAGLRDLVNHHYVQIFGASLALAAVAATAQIGNNAGYGTYDWGVQMRSGCPRDSGRAPSG